MRYLCALAYKEAAQLIREELEWPGVVFMSVVFMLILGMMIRDVDM